jgi:energy-coupling factor transport system permease protein
MNLNVKDTNFLTGLNTITKIIISLLFSVIVVFLKSEISLWIVFGASVLYLLPLKKYKLMVIMYLLILMMFGISTLFTGILTKMMANMRSPKTEMTHGAGSEKPALETDNPEKQSEGSEEVSAAKPKKRMGHPGAGSEKISMMVPFLRTALMMNLMFALTLSSGIRKLTNVLKTIRLPRFMFLPIIVVFRFVPSFLNEIRQIAENMKIKTAQPAIAIMFSKPRLYLRLLLIPSVIRSLRVAEELSAAAELKGISSSKNITNSVPEKWKLPDFAVLSLSLILAAAVLILDGGAV